MMDQKSDVLAEGRRIYLGNILYSVEPQDIEQTLADHGFGNFIQIHLSVDPVSGRNPGYCFVDFEQRATAERAIAELHASIRGRPLKVGPCFPKTERRAGGPWSRDGGRGGRNNYRGGDENRDENRDENCDESRGDTRDPDTASRFPRWGDWKRSDVPRGADLAEETHKGPYAALSHFHGIFERKEGKRLYIGGLGKVVDSAANYEEMHALLEGLNPTAIGKRVTAHESMWNKPGNHNYCFVDFATEQEAETALRALDGKFHNGDKLRVSFARGHPERPKFKDQEPRPVSHITTIPAESALPKTFRKYGAVRKDYGAGTSSRALEATSWRRKD